MTECNLKINKNPFLKLLLWMLCNIAYSYMKQPSTDNSRNTNLYCRKKSIGVVQITVSLLRWFLLEIKYVSNFFLENIENIFSVYKSRSGSVVMIVWNEHIKLFPVTFEKFLQGNRPRSWNLVLVVVLHSRNRIQLKILLPNFRYETTICTRHSRQSLRCLSYINVFSPVVRTFLLPIKLPVVGINVIQIKYWFISESICLYLKFAKSQRKSLKVLFIPNSETCATGDLDRSQ